MKWFFCLNGSDKSFLTYVQVAVNSAQRNTTLEPYCIFDGEECEITEWLRSKNVPVIFFREPFYKDYLEKHGNYILSVLNTFHSPPLTRSFLNVSYLRAELPNIVRNVLSIKDSHILYVDVDVVFNKTLNESWLYPEKSIAAAAPDIFNSGVMSFNIDRMNERLQEFKQYVLSTGLVFYYCDQGAFQNFYQKLNNECVLLPNEYNWSPISMPYNPDPYIIHYKGLKPDVHYQQIIDGDLSFADSYREAARNWVRCNCVKYKDGIAKYFETWKGYRE